MGLIPRFTVSLGYWGRQVFAEVDNQSIITMLLGNNEELGVHDGMIRGIRDPLSREWKVELKHVYRESNFVSDCLAALATYPRGYQRLFDPPLEVEPWLEQDIVGISHSHNVII